MLTQNDFYDNTINLDNVGAIPAPQESNTFAENAVALGTSEPQQIDYLQIFADNGGDAEFVAAIRFSHSGRKFTYTD